MFQNSFFQVEHQKGVYNYNTDSPFRIALTSEMGSLHSIVYFKSGCARCSPESAPTEPMGVEAFWNIMVSKYKKDQVKNCLKWFLYFNANKPRAIDSKMRSIFNTINEYMHQYKIDTEQLHKFLLDEREAGRKERFINGKKTIEERNNSKYQFAIKPDDADNVEPDANI